VSVETPSNDAAPNHAAPNDAALTIWRVVREHIAGLWRTHGSPADVALFGFIGSTLRRELLSWLQPIEGVLRRLIARDAALLAPSLKLRPLRKHKRAGTRRVIIDPAQPETWRVVFRSDEKTSARAHRGARTLRAPSPYESFALALRFEACVRVFNDPGPFARRLAFRLARGRVDVEALTRMPRAFADRGRWRLGRDSISDASFLLIGALAEMEADTG
jgi:hypothetical protein